jgi:hypothetical protein
METFDVQILCTWKPIRFSWYDHGVIAETSDRKVQRIYRNRWTERIRIYATSNLHDKLVSVNGAPPVKVESKGRFGMLYLEVR